MDIRLVSSLNEDDEARLASAICNVVSCLLDQFGIAYTLRIETTEGQVFHETSCRATREVAADVAAS